MNGNKSNALVVNAIFDIDVLKIEVEQQSVLSEVLKKALRLFEKNDIYILSDKKSLSYIRRKFKDFNLLEVEKNYASNVLLLVYNKLRNYDNIVYLFADEPLIDIALTKKLISHHIDEFADYSYGEGFVKGILPEVISVEILPRLASLNKNENKNNINNISTEINRNTLFDLISKDINSFDIETIFADKDLRLLRFELTTSEKRNRMIVERLVSIKKSFDLSYEDICNLIDRYPEIIRTVPSYVEIELMDKIRYPIPYIPVSSITRKRKKMEYKNYKLLLNSLVGFTDHVYISISYLGEPLLYPDIRKLIEETVKVKNISLIVETDGIDFTPDFSNFISDLNSDNLSIIFQIDAIKEDTYRKIHGTEIKYVERNARYLLSKMKKNVYVQMVRMDINEDEMLDFYKIWEGEGAGIIIQKYNDFLGVLPKLSSVDLRPLEQICCYHLMRDMVIFFDGNVPRCKQDINGKYLLGNVFNKTIESVWEEGKLHFKNHCMKNYDEDCKRCDEYYIFNF